jgi:hypothetical protein
MLKVGFASVPEGMIERKIAQVQGSGLASRICPRRIDVNALNTYNPRELSGPGRYEEPLDAATIRLDQLERRLSLVFSSIFGSCRRSTYNI